MLKQFLSTSIFFVVAAAGRQILAVPGGAVVPTPAAVSAAAPIRVTVWTWLLKIENVNYPADELTVDMYVTFTYDLQFKDKINPMKHFEIVEAKNVTVCEQDEEPRPERGEYRQSFRCLTVIQHHWDIRSFPFDRHKIHFRIEDSMDKAGTVRHEVAPDCGQEEITTRDRTITDYSVSVGEHQWGWGDAFSACEVNFTLIPQHPWGIFRKLFLTVFIALAVALLSFYVDPSCVESRFGLLVGSLFAAIANQYVVSNCLPLAGTVTLADAIHQLAYLVILLCLGLSVLSLKFVKKDRIAVSHRIDRWGFLTLLAGYVIAVTVVVLNAMERG